MKGLIEHLAGQMDRFDVHFDAFSYFFDDWDHMAYIAAGVDGRTREHLVTLANLVHMGLAKLLSVTPEPYYADNRFHLSILSALLESGQAGAGPSWTGGTSFDRSLHQLSNAELLLRKGPKADLSEGLYHGTMPPLPGVPHDQPAQVACAAQIRAGPALCALPPIRPAALCLRLGRQFFAFPLSNF